MSWPRDPRPEQTRVAVARWNLLPAAALIGLASCSSRPAAVEPPDLDPAAAAAAAIEQLDQDGSGDLSASELEASALSLERWDADQNGAVSVAEMTARWQKFLDSGIGLIGLTCRVVSRSGPLVGAQVTFEPESFQGGAVQPASGETDLSGTTTVSVAEEFRPQPAMTGVQPGLYRVRITHPTAQISPAYNSDTTLSYEVTPLEQLGAPTFRVE